MKLKKQAKLAIVILGLSILMWIALLKREVKVEDEER